LAIFLQCEVPRIEQVILEVLQVPLVGFCSSGRKDRIVLTPDNQRRWLMARSARSLSQCANRESILAGAVLGLAGPGKKISGIMPCTVIRPGDMADNILDRDKHPEWNGERTRMVYP
jgi:hypothetical protein